MITHAIVLKPEEELKSGEEMIEVRTVGLLKGEIGYVGTVRNFSTHTHLDIRYVNLKAERVPLDKDKWQL